MRDEDPRQVEQQRRVLVAARIQPGQRHQHFAPAHVGVADQVEGGIGRDEAVLGERAQQMRAAAADHAARSRRGRAPGPAPRPAAGWGGAHRYRPSARRSGAPTAAQSGSASSRARVSASRSACQPAFVAQRRQPGPAQQRPQRRIAERGPVELAEMGVAAAVVQQHGIADVVQRRAVLPGGQRAEGGAGDNSGSPCSVFPPERSR